jgi:hypothetical protein
VDPEPSPCRIATAELLGNLFDAGALLGFAMWAMELMSAEVRRFAGCVGGFEGGDLVVGE